MALSPSSGWGYYSTLTISGPSSDYQMKIDIRVGNSSNNDEANGIIYDDYHCYYDSGSDVCKDHRFASDTDPSASSTDQLYEWTESITADVGRVVWVKTNGNSNIYLFIGNSNASEYSDGENTFLFFDSFDNNFDTNNTWTVLAGTWTWQSGGYLKGTGSSTSHGVRTKTQTFNRSDGIAVDMKVWYSHFGSNKFWYVDGAAGWGDDLSNLYRIQLTDSAKTANPGDYENANYLKKRISGSDTTIIVNHYGTYSAQEWVYFSLGLTSSKVYLKVIYADGTTHTGDASDTYFTGSKYVIMWADFDNNGYAYFDDVRVRKFADQEPSWSDFGEWQDISSGGEWQWVRKINISNSTSDFQLKFRIYEDDSSKDDPNNCSIDLAGHSSNFPNDIRFGKTNNPNNGFLPQFIEQEIIEASDADWKFKDKLENTDLDPNRHGQGYCWDGTYHYISFTDDIKKYNSSWTLVDENSNILQDINNYLSDHDISNTIDHIGGMDYYNGYIYITAEDSNDNYESGVFVKIDPSDLSVVETSDWKTWGSDHAPGLTVKDGIIYKASAAGDKIQKYNVSNYSHINDISLSQTISYVQDITIDEKTNHFIIFTGGNTYNNLYEFDESGNYVKQIYHSSTYTIEGGDYVEISDNKQEIRFMWDRPGTGQCYIYYFERIFGYVDIWVKLPNPTQDYIYLFTGNSNALYYSESPSSFFYRYDDFSGDYYSLSDYTTVDNGDSDTPSDWEMDTTNKKIIQHSNIYDSGDGFGSALLTGLNLDNYRIFIKIKEVDNDGIGVLFSYQSSSQYYGFFYEQGQQPYWALSKDVFRNTASSFLDSTNTPTPSTSTIYEFKILKAGSTIKVYRKDSDSWTEILSATDSTYGAGDIGLATEGCDEGEFHAEFIVAKGAYPEPYCSSYESWTAISGFSDSGVRVFDGNSVLIIAKTSADSPLKIYSSSGGIINIALVAVDDSNASPIRIYTGSEVKALRKYTS